MADYQSQHTGAQIDTCINTYQPLINNGTSGQFYRGDKTWSNTINGNILNITNNSNTTTIGSQNSGFCHIYNSADIPFIFNNSIMTTKNTSTLGSYDYPFHQLILGGPTTNVMTASSTNPRITFCEATGTQPVHLIYTDYDSYRSPAGLKVIGGDSATPAWFEVEGAVYGKSWNATSSRYVKDNIVNLKEMGNILDQLNPVSFIYKDDPFNEERYGLIYEDTIKFCPIICHEHGQSKTINYIDLIPILIKEIQSLRKRLKSLEDKNK